MVDPARLSLNELAAECHHTAEQHGFWDHKTIVYRDIENESVYVENPSIYAEKIALIHSELSEMLECLRKNKGEEELAMECADVLIRLLDFTAARNIDLDQAVADKMMINDFREHLHGKNF